MRIINHKNVSEFINFLNSKFKTSHFSNFILRIHDDKFAFNLTRGDENYVSFVYIEEDGEKIIVNVAGNLLEHADVAQLPINNEVEEYSFLIDYLSTEIFNFVNTKYQVEYLTMMGMLEQ